MAWPSGVDYRDALQHPKRVFELPELRSCRVETNHLGVPRPRSGASAQVYRCSDDRTTRAVRVFLDPSARREQHYRAVSEHLATVVTGSLVGFVFHPEGIRLGAERFPVLTMDWVEGPSLGEWMRLRVAAGDFAAVRRMADRWIALMKELRSSRIAHGDLQHDNIMVVGETLKLVDYDGMCVPRLVGEDALENGKPGYQHPFRAGQKLSLELDHFSAWIVLLALRAVADRPRMWLDYVERPGNENLLFTENDLTRPDASRLWRELLSFDDPEVRSWATRLRACLPDRPFDSIPPFDTDEEEIVETIDVPSSLPPSASFDGGPRETARRALETAVRIGELQGIVDAYRPDLLDDWPDCAGLVLRARQATAVLQGLTEVREALKSPGDGRDVLRVWSRHSARLTGVPEAAAIRKRVEGWQTSLGALDRFLKTLVDGSECAIAQAWRALQQAGGRPEAAQHADRARLAEQRCALLRQLEAIPTDLPADKQDEKLLLIWDAKLMSGCAEAQHWLARWETAKERQSAWQALLRAMQVLDYGRIVELAKDPLLQNHPPFVEALPRIRKLIDVGPRAQRILNRLERGDSRTFEAAEDRALLRDLPNLFAAHRDSIAAPNHVWSVGAAMLVAGRPPLEQTADGEGIRVRWNWRVLPELDRFLLAVEDRFLELPAQTSRLVHVDQADYRRGLGGFLVPVPPGASEVRVTVWPILRLDWIELACEPLHLGPLSLDR